MGGWPQLSDVGERGYWGENPENRAMWAWFSLMHDGGGCFCIGGMLFGWDKVRLSGWMAAIEQCGQERVLGTKSRKLSWMGSVFANAWWRG